MPKTAVKDIYNQLFLFEGKWAKSAYPIHKKLNKHTFAFTDVYQWIAKNYPASEKSHILDAGCGVGYGSIFFAKQFNCNVTGISLSEWEIEKSKNFAKNEKVHNKLSFHLKSYDTLTPNSYDLIFAVESIKHTTNLATTLHSLKTALKPKGLLIIIDDFLIDDESETNLKRYVHDWQLDVVLKYGDFKDQFKLKKDLTPFVKTKNTVILQIIKYSMCLVKPFYPIAQIIRGGIYLEYLFKHNLMRYYILAFKKV